MQNSYQEIEVEGMQIDQSLPTSSSLPWGIGEESETFTTLPKRSSAGRLGQLSKNERVAGHLTDEEIVLVEGAMVVR